MLTAQIKALFEDSSFVEELKAAKSAEEMKDVFRLHGAELSDEDFAEFLKTPAAELQGEIDESQLDEVSGGAVAFAWGLVKGALAWSVSIHGIPEAAAEYTINWWANEYGECDVSDWTDIRLPNKAESIKFEVKTVGRDVISLSDDYTLGLRADGTVIMAGYNYYFKQQDISDWKDIISVSAGVSYAVGLKSDGTVVAIGDNVYGQCDVSDWTDIVSVSASYRNTAGLKSDGTVVVAGSNSHGQRDVSGWTNIVAVSTGDCCTVGLKADGTVVTVGGENVSRATSPAGRT